MDPKANPLTESKSVLAPIVDKVGVPLLLLAVGFGLGYIVAKSGRNS